MGEETNEDIVAPIIDNINVKKLAKYKSSFKTPRSILLASWSMPVLALLVNKLLQYKPDILAIFKNFDNFIYLDIQTFIPIAFFILYLLSFRKPFWAFLLATLLIVVMIIFNVLLVPGKFLGLGWLIVVVVLFIMGRALIYSYKYEQLMNTNYKH